MSRIARLLPVIMSGAATPWYLSGGVAAANCIAAYKAIGAASLAASYINLANPGTYNLTLGSAPTFDTAVGWTFDGLANNLKTGITPDDSRNWSMICRFSNGGNGHMMGGFNGAGGYFIIAPNRNTTRRYWNGTDLTTVAASSTSGVQCIAGDKGYINAALDRNVVTASITQAEIFIGSQTNGLFWAGNIQAAAIYNSILTPTQVLAISNAMAALPFEVSSPTYSGISLDYNAGEFTTVIIGDSQNIAASYPEHLVTMGNFINQYKYWLNTKIVLHMGDLVNNPAITAEWEAIDAFYDILDAYNIPYLITIGNHDYATPSPTRDATTYNTYFPQSRYTDKAWWNGGFYEVGHSENAYLLMTIDEEDYIFVTLEPGPRAAVVAWADAVLTTYATRKAIIITHAYLFSDSTRIGTGYELNPHLEFGADCHDGEELWNDLIKLHDNIILVHCGHVPGYGKLQSESDGGKTVSQILFDYQSVGTPEGNDATMRFLMIDASAKTIHTQQYDPIDAPSKHLGSDFDFTYTWTF